MKLRIILFSFIILIGISIVLVLNYKNSNKRTLPILNPNNINPTLVDSSLHKKGIGHKLLDFELINQDGDIVTQSIIKNKIVVADFFFTTCQSICPEMSNQLKRVHDHFLNNDKVIILSHTVWPEIDSVSVLKDYSLFYEANPKKWQFLTGEKVHLYDLARKSYLVAPHLEDTTYKHGSENDFVHTENFVLIDNKKRIRKYYDGTDPEEIDELILDIENLLESFE